MATLVHYHTDCPWFAGCENMLANLLNDPENRRRFDVSLSYRATPDYTAGLTRRTRLDFPVYPLGYPEPSDALPTPESWPRAIRRGVRFLSRQLATYPLFAYEIRRLTRLFRELRPDIVHINNGGYPAALSARAAAIAARRAGVRHVVMVVNNQAEAARGLPVSPRRAVDRRVAAAVSRFVTGSASAAAQLRRVLGLPDGRTVTLPNGIALRPVTESREETLARLGLDDGDGVLLGVVALMVPRKGHRVLLDAVAELAGRGDQLPPFTVLLEGEGPLRAELEASARDRGLTRYCRFVGPEANVMNLMAAIDVLVLPSVGHEDFPNVILEAMGMGKAVIASRLAGTPEQVDHGETGLLVTPGDARDLAIAMAQLIADPQEREAMGRAGRRRFEARFTAEAAVHRYTALYQSLMSEHHS